MSARHHELDWLRVCLFALLVVHHAVLGFHPLGERFLGIADPAPTETALGAALLFSHTWRLPALFLVAGLGTWLATSRRAGLPALGRRLARLLVPLVFGTLVVNWVGYRFVLWAGADPLGIGPDPMAWFLDNQGTVHFMHLWFLAALAVYTLLCWPLVAARTRLAAVLPEGRRLIGPLVVVVVAIGMAGKPFLPHFVGDGYKFFWYLGFFASGILLGPRIGAVLGWLARRAWWLAAAALALFAFDSALVSAAVARGDGFAATMLNGGWVPAGLGPVVAPLPTAAALVEGLRAWASIGAAAGLCARHLSHPSPVLSRLTEATFPVYVFHFPILLACIALALRLSWPWPIELAATIALTLGGSYALWRLVRPLGPIAVLVGGPLRPLPAAAAEKVRAGTRF